MLFWFPLLVNCHSEISKAASSTWASWRACSVWRQLPWKKSKSLGPTHSGVRVSHVEKPCWKRGAIPAQMSEIWIKPPSEDFTVTFHFHALEKEMATHSSVLAWRIPGMGEPGRLPSVGSHRVGQDWSDLAVAAAAAAEVDIPTCCLAVTSSSTPSENHLPNSKVQNCKKW